MHFTRTPLKNKKPVTYGTNKMGQYYSNVRVPIKNYNTTPIAARIDKNMTNLNVNEEATNKKLNQFIQHIHLPVVIQPEPDLNIFNYKCNTEINMNTALSEKTKKSEEDYEEMKLSLNKDMNIFNYNYDSIDANVGLAEKTKKFEKDYEEIKLIVDVNKESNVFNYKYNSINMNVSLAEKTKKFEEDYEEIELTLNKDINIFNYNYDSIDANIGLADQIKKFEEDYEEIKLKLNKVNNTNMNLKTDDKHFNSFVNVLTIPDKNNDDTDEEYINKPYTKLQITSILKVLQLTNVTIENVYQEKYGSNVNATGIGDFIRGSYFLMQFCKENNLFYNINMLNHPISQFLEIYQNKQPLKYKNINKFNLTNFNPNILDDNILTNIYDHTINNDFIYFLKDQTVHNKYIYTYIISYPSIIITEEHKTYMQHLLKPTNYLSLLVDEQLTNLRLIEKEFSIIHVRYGDNYLIKNESDIKLSHLNTIGKTIDYLDPTNKILLVSDNIIIKNILTKLYPHILTQFNEITHTGEGLQLDTNKLKNTMIDFYLFSRAKNVYAFSVYKHGTGFSKWATETYSIPYICRFLE